jgi:hypothetical protein
MDESVGLTPAQQSALAFVTREATDRRAHLDSQLQALLRSHRVPLGNYQAAMDRLRAESRVVLAFHPDRVGLGGRTVVEGLLADGEYRNSFETGLSSGSTSGFAGGRRDVWERQLFGGSYHRPGVTLAERPKYGALFLVSHADGPCPRFGSCYFVLRQELSRRSSFTLLGSQEERAGEWTGTLKAFEPVMVALAHHLDAVSAPLGVEGLSLQRLLSDLRSEIPIPTGLGPDARGRALDSFVEAQVHGRVDLGRDVEELVADACFSGTAVGDGLAELASVYGISLRWHPGFALESHEFPEVFRGFTTRRVAERVAVEGVVNAFHLGVGENRFRLDPTGWDEFGSTSEVLTSFRRVWHVLVLRGRPGVQWADVATS